MSETLPLELRARLSREFGDDYDVVVTDKSTWDDFVACCNVPIFESGEHKLALAPSNKVIYVREFDLRDRARQLRASSRLANLARLTIRAACEIWPARGKQPRI